MASINSRSRWILGVDFVAERLHVIITMSRIENVSDGQIRD